MVESAKLTHPGSKPCLRVLFQNRANAFSQRGGDTVVMEKLKSNLESLGVTVDIDVQGNADVKQYDLVHLFNFALPEILEAFGKRAQAAGLPFVVTSLNEDVRSFHTQSQAWARGMESYVASGQNRSWWQAQIAQLKNTVPSGNFQNSWVAKNAALIFSNGPSESALLQSLYGAGISVEHVYLGAELGIEADANLFQQHYGVSDFIFCVGRFESRKNQLSLLKALEDSDIPIVFAAGGFTYQPEYAQAVRQFRRKGKTIICDKLSPEMLASAYASARLHALPSWYELPGLVSLEAGLLGCSIVASDTGTTRDYLQDKAFYCQPHDEEGIRNAVLAAYYGPRKEGVAAHISQFTWQACARKTLVHYERVLQKSGPKQIHQSGVTSVAIATDHNAIQQYLEQGEKAAQDKNYAEALDRLEKVLQLSPQHARALRAKGAVFLAQDNIQQAFGCFHQSNEQEEKNPKTLSGLGMCFMRLGNPRQAHDVFVQALDVDPNQPVALLQLVECAYVLNSFEGLEQALANFLKFNPENLDFIFCYAGCLTKLGRLAEAEGYVSSIRARNPQYRGLQELVDEIAKQKREAAAIPASFATTSSRLTPSTSSPHADIEGSLAQAEELKRKKDISGALACVNVVLSHVREKSPAREQAECLHAECIALQGRLQEAETMFLAILETYGPNARAHAGLGAIAGARADWPTAQSRFEKALAIDSHADAAMAGLGLCAAERKDAELAWKYFRQAIRTNPENATALLGMMEQGYPLGKHAEVQEALEEYLETHPADLNFLYSLATCYYVQGKAAEARSELQKVLLFEPEHQHARELLGKVEEKLDGGAIELR